MKSTGIILAMIAMITLAGSSFAADLPTSQQNNQIQPVYNPANEKAAQAEMEKSSWGADHHVPGQSNLRPAVYEVSENHSGSVNKHTLKIENGFITGILDYSNGIYHRVYRLNITTGEVEISGRYGPFGVSATKGSTPGLWVDVMNSILYAAERVREKQTSKSEIANIDAAIAKVEKILGVQQSVLTKKGPDFFDYIGVRTIGNDIIFVSQGYGGLYLNTKTNVITKVNMGVYTHYSPNSPGYKEILQTMVERAGQALHAPVVQSDLKQRGNERVFLLQAYLRLRSELHSLKK